MGVYAFENSNSRADIALSWIKILLGIRANDPSAGSPTETLLRLLLPLNDKVQATSRR